MDAKLCVPFKHRRWATRLEILIHFFETSSRELETTTGVVVHNLDEERS